MSEFTIDEISQATKAQVLVRCQEKFSGVCTDTRKLQPGQIFVALTGENFDGHAFLEQAAALGAGAVLVSTPPKVQLAVTTLLCDNTLKALQDLAHFHRQRFQLPVIAVTGSNGKTTTKDMIAAVLSQKFNVHKTQGNFNNEIGLPLTLLGLKPEHQVLVVEMGMRGLGQIRDLCAIAQPNMGVVTMVGETHLELLGSLEQIAKAKSELVEALPASGVVVLNEDDDKVRSMQTLTQAKVVSFGLTESAGVRAAQIRRADSGLTFQCLLGGQEFSAYLPVLGEHNVKNALAAVAIGHELGLNSQELVQGLAGFAPSGMRQAFTSTQQFTVINDAYNASPVSMRAALKTLKLAAKQRSIAVLGDMLELGDYAQAAHAEVGRECAELRVDCLITVGELSRLSGQTAFAKGVSTYICNNHDEAKQVLTRILQPGDTILVKGSRGMKMEVLAQFILDLDGEAS